MSATLAPEKRIQRIELRDVETTDSLSMLRATAVPYGTDANVGWYLEQHAPGSFAKSLKEAAADLPLLAFHNNRTWPIGAADEWDDGQTELVGTWRLDGSEEAQRAGQLARDGMLNFMSIGFMPIRSEWELVEDWNPDLGPEHMDRVTRLESRLLETSMVSTPAFKDAAVKWVRSADSPRRRDQGRREVEEWRRTIDALKSGATR